MPWMAGLAGLAASRLAQQFENLLQTLDLALGFLAVLQEASLALFRLRSTRHLRKSLQDLLFGKIDVLERIKEQVGQSLFGSHWDIHSNVVKYRVPNLPLPQWFPRCGPAHASGAEIEGDLITLWISKFRHAHSEDRDGNDTKVCMPGPRAKTMKPGAVPGLQLYPSRYTDADISVAMLRHVLELILGPRCDGMDVAIFVTHEV
jgi:hypothetical protein